MLDGWTFGLAANLTITAAFIAVPALLAHDLTRDRQWRNNPLAVATIFLFIGCAGSHGVRTLQLLGPILGWDVGVGLAARYEYNWWHISVFDWFTAAAGIWYWTMRAKFPALVRGTAIFEDLRTRQMQALEVNDNIVQGLARAKLALELDEREMGEEALSSTLDSAKHIITELLGEGEDGPKLGPGGLRRRVVGR